MINSTPRPQIAAKRSTVEDHITRVLHTEMCLEGAKILGKRVMDELDNYITYSPQFRVGDRVQLLCSFNHGAKGIVEFIEPTGAIWVTRDNAASPLRFEPHEVKSL